MCTCTHAHSCVQMIAASAAFPGVGATMSLPFHMDCAAFASMAPPLPPMHTGHPLHGQPMVRAPAAMVGYSHGYH